MTTTFKLLAEADTPTFIGKAWWNQALQLTQHGDNRRQLIGASIGFGAVLLAPLGIAALASDDDDDVRLEQQAALEAQKNYGWSFGSETEYAAVSTGVPDPLLRSALPRLASDLAPKNPTLVPAYVPTLFQSIDSKPQKQGAGRPAIVPLIDFIAPLRTKAMLGAESAGGWLKSLLVHPVPNLAVVVDLPGPESVAFAAAVADRFDPVFLFDNWPHPRGVVPAHQTLAAAVALQQDFVDKKVTRPTTAPPLFVLDRSRLSPYADDQDRFDNRWLARLPQGAWLKAAGIERVLYVAPSGPTIESDDVVDDFLAWQRAGIDVRAIQLEDISSRPNPAADFGGLYWGPPVDPYPPPTKASAWRPSARATAYSAGAVTGESPHLRPAGFGRVPVAFDVATGVLLGAAFARSGSWRRTSSSSSFFSFGGG